jgi:hypothetical protein
MAVGWYLIDFARSRHTNPARIPVSPLGCRYYTSRPEERLVSRMAVGWYLIDFACSRHTNPARIPVSPLGCRYYGPHGRCRDACDIGRSNRRISQRKLATTGRRAAPQLKPAPTH